MLSVHCIRERTAGVTPLVSAAGQEEADRKPGTWRGGPLRSQGHCGFLLHQDMFTVPSCRRHKDHLSQNNMGERPRQQHWGVIKQ